MHTTRRITTEFGRVILTRDAPAIWSLTLNRHTFRFEYVNDSALWCGETIRIQHWNLEINGEVNDQYPTLHAAVTDAQAWAKASAATV